MSDLSSQPNRDLRTAREAALRVDRGSLRRRLLLGDVLLERGGFLLDELGAGPVDDLLGVLPEEDEVRGIEEELLEGGEVDVEGVGQLEVHVGSPFRKERWRVVAGRCLRQ